MVMGISIDQLREKLSDVDKNPNLAREFNFLLGLMELCTEIDPWLPIDDKTPKDKELLFKCKREYMYVGQYDHLSDCFRNDSGYEIYATHYKELA